MIRKLPSGWCRAKLGSIISLDYGKGLVKKVRDYNGKFIVFGSNGPVGKHSNFLVKEPCLIVGRKGAVGEIHMSKNPCWPIDTTYFITPPNGISLDFLFHFLSFLKLGKLDKSTAIPGLNRNDAYNVEIYLPPTNEQHRIVAKIEELFTKLDAGVKALKQAQAQLKRYRRSVLKAAVEGRLTAKWRELGKDEFEPADKLLERILQERRDKWEAEKLSKYKSKGKKPPKNWQDKYKEPTPPDTTDLPELPEGWAYTTMNSISEVIHYGYTASSSSEIIGPKMLRITDIQKGKVNWNNVPYCKIDSELKDKYLLKPGDLVFARTGATVGKSYLIKNDVPGAVFEAYLIRIILYKQIDKKFVYSFFQSPQYWLQIVKGQLGIGQPNVNATTLSKLVIPLPPLEEQKLIENEIYHILSIADEMNSLVDSELKRAQSLRQSILKRAFEGKLVPQDPNDLPASALLERIKSEKAKSKKSKQMEI